MRGEPTIPSVHALIGGENDIWRRYAATLTDAQALMLDREWTHWAAPSQLPPPGDWRVWLLMAGRGFGKTRAGAEWVRAVAARGPHDVRIALVGPTAHDVRTVMIEGDSGVLACARDHERPHWEASIGRLVWPNGVQAQLFSSEAPERLRGPQHHYAWCDEFAAWHEPGPCWANLQLGLRLGLHPRAMVTTTPRPIAALKTIIADPRTVVTRGRTDDNKLLAPGFHEAMRDLYAGTRLGRQELNGELIDDARGALWTRAMIERCRVRAVPPFRRVVVAVDPPAGVDRDACGIVVAALGSDGKGYVIEDATVEGASPADWARAVAEAAGRHGADRVVAEANNGGAMIESVLRAASETMPVRLVHATHGKSARAEPVAAHYERGRVHHAGAFPELEDQLCGLIVGGGYEGPGRSPDRADACVWALTELLLGRADPVPRVRGL